MEILAPPPSASITSGVCTGVAIIATVARLFIRAWRSRLWFDDALTIISACALLAQMLVLFINPDQQDGVVRFYVLSDTLYTTIWFARLSILFSIIRIARGALRPLRGLFLGVAFFLAAWAFLIAQLFWDCEPKTSWKHLATPRCDVSRFTSVCLLITDVISDGVLLYYPVQLFTVIQEKGLRYRLMIIFGTCVITIIPSVIHMVYSFDLPDKPSFLALVAKAAVSLIVCHIPVLSTAIFRLQENRELPFSPSGLRFRVATSTRSHWTTGSPATEEHASKADAQRAIV